MKMKNCFRKFILKINRARTSNNVFFFLCMTILLSIVMTFIVVLNYRGVSYLVFQSPANISAIFYNLLSPFIAVAAAAFTFMAFWVQHKANEKMLENHERQEVERQFYEMLHIHKENVKELKWDQWTILESSNPNFIGNNESFFKGKFFYNNRYAYKQIMGRKVFYYHDLELFGVKNCLDSAIETVRQTESLNIKTYDKLNSEKKILAFIYKVFYEGMGVIKEYFDEKADEFFDECEKNIDKMKKEFLQNKCLKFEKYKLLKEYFFDDINGHIYLYLYFFLHLFNEGFRKSSSESRLDRELCGSDFFYGHVYELNHYYRHLYQMVKIVANYDESVIEYREKRKYLKMLRAQLTSNEQLMLFYNWLSGYGWDWENEKNHFFTKYRMIHNINMNDSEFFKNVGFENVIKMIKKENPNYREYENDYLFEFEERMVTGMMSIYNKIQNETTKFVYCDLLPYEIKKFIGDSRYDKAAKYLVNKYRNYLYNEIPKENYNLAVADIQKHITQMFVWED